ncbi:uncharacterized protein [Amphiura filiformis]|uniref:uncharacterized protein n=1 Tax=Amphiura filiformis TaxID=82378 RepID=UPI003B218808
MAEEASRPNPPLRIMTWGPAKSLSTVFEKCLSFVDGVQIINEPYQCAATLGPEGIMGGAGTQQGGGDEMEKVLEDLSHQIEQHDSGDVGWDDKYCTYEWAQKTLESDFPGKKLVFCKDLISGIYGKHDYLPKGYLHTFIIRNPLRVGLSLHTGVVATFLQPGMTPDQVDITAVPILNMCPGYGFGEMVELIEHLKKSGQMKGEPIIIDADDLQNHPESIISQYCVKTGIPYSKSLLSWEAGDGIVNRSWIISKGFLQANRLMHYFDAAFASTEFKPAKELPSTLPPDVIKYGKLCEPHYRKLYDMRIKP